MMSGALQIIFIYLTIYKDLPIIIYIINNIIIIINFS